MSNESQTVIATTGVSSIELSKNAKNEFSFTVKIYFPENDPDVGREIAVSTAEKLLADIRQRLIKAI